MANSASKSEEEEKVGIRKGIERRRVNPNEAHLVELEVDSFRERL